MTVEAYETHPRRFGPRRFATLSARWGLFAALCLAMPGLVVSATSSPHGDWFIRPAAAATNVADKFTVVDCVLPGQVRKLGRRTTYLTARRATKTSILDCEIRGGEYVAYDRASYQTALNVWMDEAGAGDPQAQLYVGEIYEKGLGVAPDYDLAAVWYKKAAEQGLAPAQVNLGNLYEKGLGVPKDPDTALAWYRRASGLPDVGLDYMPFGDFAQQVEGLRQELASRTEQLELRTEELAQRTQEVEQLRGSLGQAQRSLHETTRQLSASQKAASAKQAELAAEQQALAAERAALTASTEAVKTERARLEAALQNAGGTDPAELQALQARLQESEQNVAKHRQALEIRNQQVTQLNSEVTQRNQEIAALQTVADSKDAEFAALKQELSEGSSGAVALRQQLDRREAELKQLTAKLSGTQTELETTKNALAARTSEATAQRQQLDSVRSELEAQQKALDALKAQQDGLVDKEEADSARNTLQMQLQDRADAYIQAEAEVARLNSALADSQGEVAQLQNQVNQLAVQATNQREQLASAELAVESSSATEDALKQEVERRAAEVGSLNQQLAELADTLQQKSAQLARREADSELASNQLAAAQQELSDTRTALEALQSDTTANTADLNQRIQALTAQYQAGQEKAAQLDAELADSRSEIGRLESQLANLEVTANSQEQELVTAEQQFVDAGPIIELIDPALLVTPEGRTIARTRGGIESRVLIGRVTAPSGLLTLTINDVEQQFDEQGLFRASLPVIGATTGVTISAVDSNGYRSALDFSLELDGSGEIAAPPTPEVKTPSQPPLVPIADVKFGNYYALVIGSNDYAHLPDLETAITDARAVSQVLRDKYGFIVTTLENATRYDILSAMNEFRETLTEEDNFLLYYAGHGELDRVNQRGHWLPIDAEPDSTANWISNVAIADILNAMNAKHVLVVADSCYSGALTRTALARLNTGMTQEQLTQWLKVMVQKRARLALTSGGLQPVYDSFGGDHSVFANAILGVLNDNGEVLGGQRLFEEVAARVNFVAQSYGLEQLPQYSPIRFAGHESGDFFFVPL